MGIFPVFGIEQKVNDINTLSLIANFFHCVSTHYISYPYEGLLQMAQH